MPEASSESSITGPFTIKKKSGRQNAQHDRGGLQSALGVSRPLASGLHRPPPIETKKKKAKRRKENANAALERLEQRTSHGRRYRVFLPSFFFFASSRSGVTWEPSCHRESQWVVTASWWFPTVLFTCYGCVCVCVCVCVWVCVCVGVCVQRISFHGFPLVVDWIRMPFEMASKCQSLWKQQLWIDTKLLDRNSSISIKT